MFKIFQKQIQPQTKSYQQTELWTMKDKTQIRVCDMSEEHVRNTLNMILKHRRNLIEEAALEYSLFQDEFNL